MSYIDINFQKYCYKEYQEGKRRGVKEETDGKSFEIVQIYSLSS